MVDKKTHSARASKWMLALALILVISLAASPFTSAAKGADKEKNKGDNGGTTENIQLPDDNQNADNEDQKSSKENAKELKEETKENAKELKENNLPDDNEQPEEQDNESIEQSENEARDQPENIVDENPIDDSADVSPDQTNGPSNQGQGVQQPVITTENEQTTLLENKVEEVENSVEEETTPTLMSEESVGQTIIESNDSQDDDQLQEIENGMSDQSSSQQNQAAVGITDSGVMNVSTYFSEGVSLMGVGFGFIIFFQLARFWTQRKYMFQIMGLTISLARIISPVQKFLSNENIKFHFGKIKCRTSYTKDEALNFFRECQRLPLNLDGRFW